MSKFNKDLSTFDQGRAKFDQDLANVDQDLSKFDQDQKEACASPDRRVWHCLAQASMIATRRVRQRRGHNRPLRRASATADKDATPPDLGVSRSRKYHDNFDQDRAKFDQGRAKFDQDRLKLTKIISQNTDPLTFRPPPSPLGSLLQVITG